MLLKDLTGEQVLAAPEFEVEIAGLSADSRTVTDGFVFAALKGARTDGTRFIEAARASGAGAILVGQDTPLAVLGEDTPTCPVIVSDDPRRTLALMAARFYERQPETLVAVTGTSGKTSVAVFVRQIFAHAGFEAASLGTIGTVTSRGALYGSLTTPDPVSLHQTLAQLADDGITHAALEASSHGLDQRRLDGLELKAAAFTNLGRDHLDYHPDVEHYLAAKMRLFDVLTPPGSPAIVNADSEQCNDFEAAALGKLATDLDESALGDALDVLLACRGRIVCTGMGKSGIIAKKLAGTLASTGSPALFLHPAEAGHGDGVTIKIDVANATGTWEGKAVETMKAQLAPAGIELQINLLPTAMFWDIWLEAPLCFTPWTHRPLGVMVLNLAYRSGVPWNESHYASPAFDAALTEASGIADPEARRAKMEEVERILQSDAVIAQPIWRPVITAGLDRVQGFEMHPTQYYDLARVWLA
mgnify:CR=1 FL=1